MASESQLRQYLAYWFQLGKKVVIRNGEEQLLPKRIIAGDRYSQEFENCWQRIMSPDTGDCYLEGTDETIAQLLASEWEIILCARCVMPIPLRIKGMPPDVCPCFDLENWPNTEVPPPRSPVNTKSYLMDIHQRLFANSHKKPEPSQNETSETQTHLMDIHQRLLAHSYQELEPSKDETRHTQCSSQPIPFDIPICQCFYKKQRA